MTMIDDIEQIRGRVSLGMAHLDEKYPGHEHRVNLDTLDVGSAWACPLAQATRQSYEVAIWNEHGMDLSTGERDWSAARGFIWPRHCAYELGAINAAWRRAYRVRLARTAQKE